MVLGLAAAWLTLAGPAPADEEVLAARARPGIYNAAFCPNPGFGQPCCVTRDGPCGLDTGMGCQSVVFDGGFGEEDERDAASDISRR